MDRVFTAVGEDIALWELQLANPSIPLYSGGLLDSWPWRTVEAFRICREEASLVRARHAYESKRETKAPRR